MVQHEPAPIGDRGHVLYLSYDGLLEPLGGSQVVPYVEGFARSGFAVEVLSFEKKSDLRDLRRRSEMASRLRRCGIGWTARAYHKRPSLPATAFDVSAGIVAGLRIVRRRARGRWLLHARSYVAGLMGLAIKRWSGHPLLFDTRSFLVDERLQAGIWRRGSAVASLARRAERRLFEAADAVTVVARSGIPLAVALAPAIRRGKIHVIPPCIDLDRFRPASDVVDARRVLGLPPGPSVVHAGALGTWYLAEQTFAIGAAFREATGGSFLVLTRELEYARQLDERLGAGASIHAVPHEEMPRWLAACDAGLALVRQDDAKRGSMPVKLGEYLACGLAVATTRGIGDLDEQFPCSDVVLRIDPSEPAPEVAGRLRRAAARAGRAGEARALAQRFFALEDGVAAYAGIYDGLLGMDRTLQEPPGCAGSPES